MPDQVKKQQQSELQMNKLFPRPDLTSTILMGFSTFFL